MRLRQVISRGAVEGRIDFPISKTLAIRLLKGLGLAAFLFLLLWNQPYFPKTWIDEGFTAQGAMNLVRYGEYAMKSSEGFRVLDQPLIANGPGIQLPIAGTFAVLGIGLWQMRLVATLFALGAMVAFFSAGQRLYGTAAAFTSAILLIALPYEGFLYYSRIAMGNIAGLFYFFVGFIFWLKLVDTRRWRFALGAGVLFGLATITKGQYNFYLLPCLAVMVIADLLYYRQVGITKMAGVLALTLGVFAAWSTVQLLIVGPENYAAHVAAVRANAVITVLGFNFDDLPARVSYLLSKGVSFIHLPAVAFALWCARSRTLDGLSHAFVPVFVMFGFAWYVVASIGWARYAFEPYAVGMLAAGHLVISIARALRRATPSTRTPGSAFEVQHVLALLTFTLIVTSGAYGVVRRVVNVTAPPDRSAETLADYLRANIDRTAVVETAEWELAIQTDLNYHHPADEWVNRATLHTHGAPQDMAAYEPLVYGPSYLVAGPFSKWAQLYDDEIERGCCEEIFVVGEYTVYRVVQVDVSPRP